MKIEILALVFLIPVSCAASDSCLFKFVKKHHLFFEWGYNMETYSKSDIRIYDGKDNDFVIRDVKADDRPDLSCIIKAPFQVTVPQYSVRLGYYLDAGKKNGLVLSFDHTKYVVQSYQSVRIKGKLKGEPVDSSIILDPDNFLHFEHTNGANFLQLGYFKEFTLAGKPGRPKLAATSKLLAGVVIPKTYVKLWGTELDNKFHLAGFILSAEAGAKFYFTSAFYLSVQFSAGYANYMDVLAACDAKASHSFFYAEGVVSIGYCLSKLFKH